VRFDYDSARIETNENELRLFVSSFPSAGKEFSKVVPITLAVRDLCQDILHPDTRLTGILADADERVHDDEDMFGVPGIWSSSLGFRGEIPSVRERVENIRILSFFKGKIVIFVLSISVP